MSKSGDDEPQFTFEKLADTDNYKKFAQEMQYSLEFARFWAHTLLNTENFKPMPIDFKNKDLKNHAKVKNQKKRTDKILV